MSRLFKTNRQSCKREAGKPSRAAVLISPQVAAKVALMAPFGRRTTEPENTAVPWRLFRFSGDVFKLLDRALMGPSLRPSPMLSQVARLRGSLAYIMGMSFSN